MILAGPEQLFVGCLMWAYPGGVKFVKIISVAGTASQSGKTTVSSFILRALSVTVPIINNSPLSGSGRIQQAYQHKSVNSYDGVEGEIGVRLHDENWNALKITVRHDGACPRHTGCDTCDDGYGPFKILTDDEIINEEGKDTDQLSKAGAAKVVWLQTDSDVEKAGLEAALMCFNKEDNVLVEGNCFLRVRDADVAILVVSPSVKKIKRSAKLILNKVDFVAINVHSNHTESDIEECKKQLRSIGCRVPYFVINPYVEEGHSNRTFIEKIQECLDIPLVGKNNNN